MEGKPKAAQTWWRPMGAGGIALSPTFCDLLAGTIGGSAGATEYQPRKQQRKQQGR
jgi:hypothetical protein